jgi:flagellin-like protein
MNNDKAVSPVIGVILMVAITVILAVISAGLVFAGVTLLQTNQNNCCNTNCDTITKTAVIHVVWYRALLGNTNYIVDSDGCSYDWWSGLHRFDQYDGHNVTFTYSRTSQVRGRSEIVTVIEDHTPCSCTPCCNACNSCVVPTSTPTLECGCH